jgi:hypothetical protein
MKTWNLFTCIFLTASLLHASPYLWIEAEKAQANFPLEDSMTYAPEAFWEEDALSDGDWLSLQWHDPDFEPEIKLEIAAEETGTYYFYVRKFSRFGAFEWRINRESWQRLDPDDQIILDSLPYREDEDRITLNWVYVGQVSLKAGTNTLRIRPIFSSPEISAGFQPLGYDVFLFSKQLFFPKGKLKPNQKYDILQAERFSFESPLDSPESSSFDLFRVPDDISTLRIKAVGSRFERDDAPFRPVAINLSNELLSFTPSLEYLINFIEKRGINTVRIELAHLFNYQNEDGPEFVLDQEALSTLVNAVDSFRKAGLYTALTWNLRGSVSARSDNIPGYASITEMKEMPLNPSLSPLLQFNEEFEGAWRRSWAAVFSAELSDGTPLGESSCVAFVTLAQQETLLTPDWSRPGVYGDAIKHPIEAEFYHWMQEKENAAGAVPPSWKGGKRPRDKPEKGRFELADFSEWGQTDQARVRDTVQFLAEHQRAFFQRSIDFFRSDLGYEGLISTTNKSTSYQGLAGMANLWSRSVGDYLETHALIKAPFEPDFNLWVISVNSRYRDRSLVRMDPLIERSPDISNLPLNQPTVNEMPVFLSEVNWARPNRFRTESLLMTFALSAIQGVDGIGYTGLSSPHWQSAIDFTRTRSTTPASLILMPGLAHAFENGYFAEGPTAARLELSDQRLFSGSPLPVAVTSDSQIGSPAVPLDATDKVPEKEKALWTQGPVKIHFDHQVEDGLSFEEFTGPADPSSIEWNTDKGLFSINQPHLQGSTGFFDMNRDIQLRDITFTSSMPFGAFTVVSLDGKPLDFSRKMLLSVMSLESNTAYYSTGDPDKIIRSIGTAPILIDNILGSLTFRRPDANRLRFTALDVNGVPVTDAAVGATLHLLPSTFYYLIERP